jgi:hypothetical protein
MAFLAQSKKTIACRVPDPEVRLHASTEQDMVRIWTRLSRDAETTQMGLLEHDLSGMGVGPRKTSAWEASEAFIHQVPPLVV